MGRWCCGKWSGEKIGIIQQGARYPDVRRICFLAPPKTQLFSVFLAFLWPKEYTFWLSLQKIRHTKKGEYRRKFCIFKGIGIEFGKSHSCHCHNVLVALVEDFCVQQ